MRGSKICFGILAHVDAGKTTLSEALLYTSGALRKLGRVDHKDAFLDNFSLERERGITIFSKQANLSWKGLELTLLDTPGHVDFSAEMERTLQVLDYCLLVISGSDGVQGHTATLWKLLKKYGIPTFLFVNKMDQIGADKEKLLSELKSKLSENVMEFGPDVEAKGDYYENLAMSNEQLMEEYLETDFLKDKSITDAIKDRNVFPCYFGSALHLDGVEALLDGLKRFTVLKEYPYDFAARVYKISRDSSGNRLTHIKITGGILNVKQVVSNVGSASSKEDIWEEKVDSIRVYAGAGFQPVDRVEAGGVCAVTGLSRTFVGQGLGIERDSDLPVLVPVLTYRLGLPEGTDLIKTLGQLRALEEEEPELHVVWKEHIREIHVQVMGEVQTEVLKSLLLERFGLEVEFMDGKLLYKETIASPVEGIGHYEPLRHYAEVHLLLEPGEPGSGITIDSDCSEDELDKNWQRLIFTHLEEKTHLGVLTGSPITDMKITLLTGRAHIKHTEGGDFRQATYRAIRHGLMCAENVLLEPIFAFTLELPTEYLGRAMSDVQRMHGTFEPPKSDGENSILCGSAPVSTMKDYQREVNAYTRGLGRLSCNLKGYEPCHNADEVVSFMDYNPDADLENPSSSVFCAHGAGFVVNWEEVAQYAHLESNWRLRGSFAEESNPYSAEGLSEQHPLKGKRATESQTGSGRSDYITQDEIEEIFKQTYKKSVQAYAPYRYHQQNTGSITNGTVRDGKPVSADEDTAEQTRKQNGNEKHATKQGKSGSDKNQMESYFLVDGYNIIFAWEDLRSLAEVNIDSARDKLMDICCNFQGYNGSTLILVYDAYKVKGNPGSVQKYHNIYVVYTKEAETADQYIEKTVHEIGKKHHVTVATSDALEQMIIWGAGATRLSARGFWEEVEDCKRRMQEERPLAEKLGNRIVIPPIVDEGK